jgi:hypothetical protein
VAGSLGTLQVELDGIPNDQAGRLRQELARCIARANLLQRVAIFQRSFAKDSLIYEAWGTHVQKQLDEHVSTLRWIPDSQVTAWLFPSLL